ncbi:AhpA/YtjB family protein [Rheinheimera baltica]|uniref:AhpA/YtjB family protein n=1 Tax=Rheinheimera baltica TaxID=67576 RepID=A0ABT9I3G8_9GAMM|nr:AhpA/YtjB family protein [Rheinheimera baltica]MDP5137521.1 AhpA/YtjB family protein [Rheinheimera baltica]MDP5143275.1 AhpA/YtjB family protein [Rheinheimera baltica]MDP5150013.1 AhpA/YtjB family protein [Rheinheimera baltica]
MQNHIPIPSSTSSTIKLLQIAIAVMGIWLLLHSWVLTQQQGKLLLQQQSSQLMRETLTALSHTAAYLIEHDELDGLEQLTQHIAASPYLYDVVVYDANGVRMSWSENSAPARLLYGPNQKEQLQAMVQPITKDQQLLGYMKLSLRLDTSLNQISMSWQQLMQQLLGMLILAGAVGFLLRRGFSRLSRQSLRLRGPKS